MTKKILIVGAGGHAKVLFDTISLLPEWEAIGFMDATIPVNTVIVNQHKVVLAQSQLAEVSQHADYFIVAIGNNAIRQHLFQQLIQVAQAATIIHPLAHVSQSASIGIGSVCLPFSVINSLSQVGKNCIINCGSIVDHETIIADHVHLSIGTKVGSNSKINSNHSSSIGDNIPPFSKL
jgi:sugar O-acyltransferase (sialic acid O-acetyltransferase NeuD family)